MRFVVVGGGIAGVAAALRLRELHGDDAEIVVLERSGRLGGKLATVDLGSLGFGHGPLESGADSFLMRERGEESRALALAKRVGLADDLVHPAALPAALAEKRGLQPLPSGTLFGIPSQAPQAAPDDDRGTPLVPVGADVAVGALVRARYGDDVVDRLVDPLLGGVYAGRADALSLAATMPALHSAAQRHPTLSAAVTEALSAAPRPPGTPIFATVRGGLSRLTAAAVAAAGAEVRFDTTVRELVRTPKGWCVTTGSTRDPVSVDADAIVLAVPARPAARLLAPVCTAAAAEIGTLDYASVALITLAFAAGTDLPELSGLLVPETEGYAIKAATFVTKKWPHLHRGPVVVRLSMGRHGAEQVLQRTDDDLADLAYREFAEVLGHRLPPAAAWAVQRWGGALPQYGVGHVARVQQARSALPQGIALAGAAYDGVGIAACVRSGEDAAQALVMEVHR